MKETDAAALDGTGADRGSFRILPLPPNLAASGNLCYNESSYAVLAAFRKELYG